MPPKEPQHILQVPLKCHLLHEAFPNTSCSVVWTLASTCHMREVLSTTPTRLPLSSLRSYLLLDPQYLHVGWGKGEGKGRGEAEKGFKI